MHTQKLTGPSIVIDAAPLTREAFAPFGDVVENPRPDVQPSAQPPSLPLNAVTANQGSAIKYQNVSHQISLYDQAPSGRRGSATMNMFVCAARARIPEDPPSSSSSPSAPARNPPPPRQPQPQPPSTFPITVLERHPYTTQTFIPLTADPTAHYLVIVAPSLPPTANDNTKTTTFPVPTTPPTNQPRYHLPGPGMPDLHRLRAFVATATQAVTYGAGTWHAPMVALGEAGTAVDFVVVQFANGVGEEDCQEVGFEGAKGEEEGGVVVVRLRPVVVGGGKDGKRGMAKL